MLSILKELYQEAMADDGNMKTFILHKLVHFSGGCVVSLLTYHLLNSLSVGAIAALLIGVIRELEKSTGMLLHVFTALVTLSGFLLTLILIHLPADVQIGATLILSIYSAIIIYLQYKSSL